MSEWLITKLGDACDILDSLRVPLNSEEREEIKGEVPYYGANGLQGFINKHIFNEPLILLAEDGGYFDDFETRPIAYRVNGPSWVNNHAHVLRAKKDGPADHVFIFYSLEHKNITPFIKGGTRAKLNQSELREITVRHPKNKVQQLRIAEILSTVDEAIKQTEALIGKLQQMKAGLMHDLFTRGVTPDGHLRPTREEAPHLYHETPLGWIPKQWEVKPLDQHIRIIDCKHYTPAFQADGYAFVRPRNVKTDGLDLSSIDYVSEIDFALLTDVHRPRPGDIVFSRNASFGVPCYVETDVPFAIGQDVVVMTAKASDARFVFAALTANFVAQQIAKVSAGSTFGRINLAEIRKLLVPEPDGDEQVRIAERVWASDKQRRSLEDDLAKLRQQKQGLMQDLLTGRVPMKFCSTK